MIVLISPAKTLDFQSEVRTELSSVPNFTKEADSIVKILKKLKISDLESLMSVSKDLAALNFDRFQHWESVESNQQRQAILAFKGDVYIGLDAASMSDDDLKFAQQHLRILSGIYGYLRPMDLIKPYRLEMGTTLAVGKHKSLYEFWMDKLTKSLKADLGELKSQTVINLASNEYSRAVQFKSLKCSVISPDFKDYKNGEYKMISFFAKKARGLMSSYIIRNRITHPDDLLAFDADGYSFNAHLSKPGKPVFTRS